MPKVLVVDDEASICRALTKVLGREYEVTSFISAAAALAGLQAGQRFDAVLVDMNLGEMTGTAFISKLRLLTPELARRCVLMTGDPTRALEVTDVPTVAKPWERTDLLNAVARAAAADDQQ